MATWRWTKFIRFRGFGDTETLWTNNASAGGALDTIQAEVSARNQALPRTASIEAVRIALDGGFRQSQLLTPQNPLWIPTGTALTIPTTGVLNDSATAGRFGGFRGVLRQTVTLANGVTTTRYLSGVPAELMVEEGVAIPFADRADFTAGLAAWNALLRSGPYSVSTLVKPSNFAPWLIVGLVQGPAPNNFIGLEFNSSTFGGTTQGARVHVYGFRPAKGTRAPTLNGTFYVDSVVVGTPPAPTVVYLRGTTGINPALQRFTDKTYMLNVAKTLSAISGMQTSGVGIHKRGKLSIVPRGRRLTRATLDP